jgi:hypothetical protein
MRTQDILSKHPNPSDQLDQIVALVNSAFACEQCCTSCADACLDEDGDMDLRYCIRTNLDCADVCATTGRALSRQTQPNARLLRAQLEACRIACDACADECAKHADMHEHCRVCMECCRECSEACQALLDAMPQGATA